MTVAILAAVESLLSAVVADNMIGDRHNSSAELIAQGHRQPRFAPGGRHSRDRSHRAYGHECPLRRAQPDFRHHSRADAAGDRRGAARRSRSLFRWRRSRRFCLSSPITWASGERSRRFCRLSNADRSVWFITFLLTVVADLTVAVEVGMALASLLYIYRIAQTTMVGVLTSEDIESGREHMLQDKEVPDYVTILRVHGPFLFGVTERLIDETADLGAFAPIVMLRLRHMTAIDATGLHALEQLSDRCKKSGRTLLLCGARGQPAVMLERADVVEQIGPENILPSAEAALDRAREIHEITARPV